MSKSPRLRDFYNLWQLLKVSCLPFRPRKSILFFVDIIHESGGVETRTLAYAQKLQARGITPVFITQKMLNADIASRFRCIKLKSKAANFTYVLGKIAKRLNAIAVEVQVTWPKSFYTLSPAKLNGTVRTGAVIHGSIPGLTYDKLNECSYRIVIKPGMVGIDYDALRDYTIIPNAIEMPQCPPWRYAGQQKGLLFSRINPDKLDVLCAGIEFMQQRGLDFDLVGHCDKPEFLDELIARTGIRREQVKVMNVAGTEFMAEHIADYLFVAGVGLVMLEAAALGYPCLITSALGAEHCTFLTRDNLTKKLFLNFTYTVCSDEAERNLVQKLDISRINDYSLRDIIQGEYSLSEQIDRYLEIID